MSKRYLANNESLIKKALYLRLMAQDIAEGMKSGNFRSLYRGQGVEFAGVRDYTRGDDIRTIDWNVTARMGRPYIKIFEEERELQIFIITDSSLSMQLENGSDRRTKYAAAAETAALVAIAAELNACPTGAVFLMVQFIFPASLLLEKKTQCRFSITWTGFLPLLLQVLCFLMQFLLQPKYFAKELLYLFFQILEAEAGKSHSLTWHKKTT